MWLADRLMPDFKTIACFRQDYGKAIQRVYRQFVVLCQQLGLFSEAVVAIDGSKFKAVNNRERNFTRAAPSCNCAWKNLVRSSENVLKNFLCVLARSGPKPDISRFFNIVYPVRWLA
jgi:hypothetical protein